MGERLGQSRPPPPIPLGSLKGASKTPPLYKKKVYFGDEKIDAFIRAHWVVSSFMSARRDYCSRSGHQKLLWHGRGFKDIHRTWECRGAPSCVPFDDTKSDPPLQSTHPCPHPNPRNQLAPWCPNLWVLDSSKKIGITYLYIILKHSFHKAMGGGTTHVEINNRPGEKYRTSK